MSLHQITAVLGCVALVFALSAMPSRAADDLAESRALLQQGNQAKALERVEAFLAGNPRDTQGRFLKGVILTELGKNTEAIRMFSMLTHDFPDLPEPYNNLAVLYALQGDYERARSTLETAIRKNPGYAIAYENLGDLHAKLASRAYEKARELDKANSGAQAKIDTIRGMLKGISGGVRPTETAQLAKPVATKPIAAEPAPAVKPEPAAVASTKAVEPAKVAAVAPPAPPVSPAPAKAAPELPRSSAAPAPAKPAPESAKPSTAAAAATPATASAEIVAALNDWARAWSSKDATAYLASYAPDFRPPGDMSRAKWEAQRRARIAKPPMIEVSVGTPTVGMRAADRAVVSFRQRYRTDAIDEADNKLMVLVKQDGRWLIQEERVVK